MSGLKKVLRRIPHSQIKFVKIHHRQEVMGELYNIALASCYVGQSVTFIYGAQFKTTAVGQSAGQHQNINGKTQTNKNVQ